ncbi:unnamed protein product, partial [marine sediment metagenome]
LKELGILVSLFKIRNIAFINAFNKSTEAYIKRFPNYHEPLTEDLKKKIILEIKNREKNSSISDIASFCSVSYPTVCRIAVKEVFKDNINAYRQRFPINEVLEMGSITHARINDLLTKHFKLKGIYYFSNPMLFLDSPFSKTKSQNKPDGLLINRKNLKLFQERLISILGIDLKLINKVKAFQFDFTTLLSKNNIIDKIKKYQHPEMILFIIGTRWNYQRRNYLELPKSKKILYPSNIKIISPMTFTYIFDLKGIYLDRFKDILYYNSEWDL